MCIRDSTITALTRKPKTVAGKALLALTNQLLTIKTPQEAANWIRLLHQWHQLYQDLINEKTYSTGPNTKTRWSVSYTHLDVYKRQGLDFTVAFVDGVIRPEDIKVAAEELNRLASSSIGFLPWYLRLPFKIGGAMAPLLPNLVIPITRSVFAKLVEMCIRDSKRTIATPPSGLLSLSRRPPPKKNNICATEVIRPPMAEATEEVKISRL